MPRTSKSRNVCTVPSNRLFTPENLCNETVTLTVEEVEALRLTDYENLEQDTAAFRMEISRGTLQRILYSARHKTSDALVNGKTIVIEGGNYKVSEENCNCHRQCTVCKFSNDK